MNTITIEAASPESALALYGGLGGFRRDLRLSADRRHALIDIDVSGDCDIAAVLNAIEEYVSQRNDGATRIVFDGRNYALHAAP